MRAAGATQYPVPMAEVLHGPWQHPAAARRAVSFRGEHLGRLGIRQSLPSQFEHARLHLGAVGEGIQATHARLNMLFGDFAAAPHNTDVYTIARRAVQVFKPAIDNRFSHDHIVSHSEMRHESGVVESADEILARVEAHTDVVGIDEGQFFDTGLTLLRKPCALPVL